MVASVSQLSSGSGFLLPMWNFQPSSHRKEPSAKFFWGLGEFCRYKKARCLGLERSEHECPQQLGNARNGDREILTARACFKDLKQPQDKRAHQSTPAGTSAERTDCTSQQPRTTCSCCPRSDGTYLDGMKHLHVTEQTLSQLPLHLICWMRKLMR